MTFFIASNSRPINTKSFETIDAAIADFCQPAYAGAKATEITMTSPTTFRHMGLFYSVERGINQAAVKASAPTRNTFRPINTKGTAYQFSRRLTREMDRADSAY